MSLEILKKIYHVSLEINLNIFEPDIIAFGKKAKGLIEILDLEFQYRTLHLQALRMYQEKHRKAPKEKIDNILAHDLLQDNPKGDSFIAQFRFHSAKAILYLMAQSFDMAKKHYKLLVRLMESEPSFKKGYSMWYQKVLANYIGSCHADRDFDAFPDILKKIRKIPTTTNEEKSVVFQNAAYYELVYCMNTFQFENGTELISEIEDGLKKYSNYIGQTRKISFYYNLAIFFFAKQDFDNSLEWLNKILHDSKSKPRQNVKRFARILELVLHYELENYKVLEYLYRSANRSLKRNEELDEFEKTVLRYMNVVPYITSKKERAEKFREFWETLGDLIVKEQHFIGLEEISIWAEAKAKNQTFIKIMKARHGQ